MNCPFYFKIGACRNGDQCNRLHNRPTMSQTLLLSHMYPNTPEARHPLTVDLHTLLTYVLHTHRRHERRHAHSKQRHKSQGIPASC